MKSKYFYHSPSFQSPKGNRLFLKEVVRPSGKVVLVQPRVCIMGVFEGDAFVFTVARCSEKDNYSKARGRRICEDRYSRGVIHHSVSASKVPEKTGTWFIEQCKQLSIPILENPRSV